jgi:hypothetical protein
VDGSYWSTPPTCAPQKGGSYRVYSGRCSDIDRRAYSGSRIDLDSLVATNQADQNEVEIDLI